MTPAELVRETRLRKGLTQRRLALRAGTSQSAVARIERGDEEVTWPRLRALMVSMGEEPVLTSKPLPNVGHVVVTGNPTDGWTLAEWDADPPPC